MKAKHFVWIGVAVFALTLLVETPMALVIKLAQSKTANRPPLLAVSGSVMQGSAEALSINNRVYNEAVKWQFQPWWLGAGRLSFDVDATGPVNTKGSVQFGLGGFTLKQTTAEAGLKDLATASGIPFMPLDGRIKFDLSTLKLKGGIPNSAHGQMDLRNLQWNLARPAALLGSFHAELKTLINTDDTNQIVAEVTSAESPLDVSGQIHFFPADQHYEVDLLVKAKANADPSIVNLINGLGVPDPQGNHRLHTSGNLNNGLAGSLGAMAASMPPPPVAAPPIPGPGAMPTPPRPMPAINNAPTTIRPPPGYSPNMPSNTPPPPNPTMSLPNDGSDDSAEAGPQGAIDRMNALAARRGGMMHRGMPVEGGRPDMAQPQIQPPGDIQPSTPDE